MWLRCLFIIMRMKISSVWLLAVWSAACARALAHHSPPPRRTEITSRILSKCVPTETEIVNLWMPGIHYCYLCSILHRARWHRKNKKSLSIICFLLQKWLDHLIPSFHRFYFLQRRAFPSGGYTAIMVSREILSTWPEAGGGRNLNVWSSL